MYSTHEVIFLAALERAICLPVTQGDGVLLVIVVPCAPGQGPVILVPKQAGVPRSYPSSVVARWDIGRNYIYALEAISAWHVWACTAFYARSTQSRLQYCCRRVLNVAYWY